MQHGVFCLWCLFVYFLCLRILRDVWCDVVWLVFYVEHACVAFFSKMYCVMVSGVGVSAMLWCLCVCSALVLFV